MVKFLEKLFGTKSKAKPSVSDQTSPDAKTEPREEVISATRLLNGQDPLEAEIPTVPFTEDSVPDISLESLDIDTNLETSHLIVGHSQSVGQQRDHNEDALFTLTINFTKDANNTTLGLYIVADGMGGHKHGEVASEIAVRTIGSQVVRKLLFSLIAFDGSPPEESLQEIIEDSVQQAHLAIIKEAPGGGTTVTAVLIIGGQMAIAHVGDSRAFSISKDGTMLPLTRDHSLVMRMIELGQLSPEEAAIHPQRNVLYRALGQGEPFPPDFSVAAIPESGYIMICSDGLWGVVPEKDITQIISTASNPQQACQNLIDAANTAGGPDNITAILIQLPD